MKASIRTKFILFVLLATIVIYTPSITYLGISNRNNYYNLSIENIKKDINLINTNVSNKINDYFTMLNTLSKVNTNLYNLSYAEREKIVRNTYKNILNQYKGVDGLWDSWEITKNDSSDKKRVSYSAQRIGSRITTETEIKGLTPLYIQTRDAGKESVIEPYLYSFTHKEDDLTMVTSLAVQLFSPQNKVIGLVGIDIKLDNINKLVKSHYKNGIIELISAKGVYLLTKDSLKIAKKADINDTLFKKLKTINSISYDDNTDNTEYYNLIERIKLGKSNDYWYLHFKISKDIISEKADKILRLTLIIGFLGLLILALFIYFIITPMLNPLKSVTKSLNDISKGKTGNVKINIKRKDELGEMSEALSNLTDSLNEKTEFAKEIGLGNLNLDLKLQSKDDVLGHALIQMKDNILSAKEQEKLHKIEEEKRKWANKGYAFFAELLRQNNDNLNNLLDNLTKHITKYLDANQCGIFLQNENNKDTLELMSAYAYDRKKYIEKQILVGEGLVGACFIEKQSIFLTDIPKGYTYITSGLGKSDPKSLFIAPIKNDDEIIGVIEIASFKEIEKYQRDFIEKLTETIASTILNVRNNIKMKELFEQVNQQAEEMRAQEEEMRQNMEELLANQEENERKTTEIENFFQDLHSTNLIIEINTNGKITLASSALLKHLETSRDELLGKDFKQIFYNTDIEKIELLWQEILQGVSKKIVSEFNFNGKDYKFYDTFVPIRDSEGNISKVIRISFDTESFNK